MKYIKDYIKHLRGQNESVKLMHSAIIAFCATVIFSFVYLYFMRGMTPPTPEILNMETVIYKAE